MKHYALRVSCFSWESDAAECKKLLTLHAHFSLHVSCVHFYVRYSANNSFGFQTCNRVSLLDIQDFPLTYKECKFVYFFWILALFPWRLTSSARTASRISHPVLLITQKSVQLHLRIKRVTTLTTASDIELNKCTSTQHIKVLPFKMPNELQKKKKKISSLILWQKTK